MISYGQNFKYEGKRATLRSRNQVNIGETKQPETTAETSAKEPSPVDLQPKAK